MPFQDLPQQNYYMLILLRGRRLEPALPDVTAGAITPQKASNFSRQVITRTRRSSRFGRPETASKLRERMRWSIAPTDEFVGVWIPGYRPVCGFLWESEFPVLAWKKRNLVY